MEGKEKKKERSNFWKQQENLCLKMETKVNLERSLTMS